MKPLLLPPIVKYIKEVVDNIDDDWYEMDVLLRESSSHQEKIRAWKIVATSNDMFVAKIINSNDMFVMKIIFLDLRS